MRGVPRLLRISELSSITGGGAANKLEEGASQVLPLQKKRGGGGPEKVSARGGDTKCFEVVSTWELGV